MASRELDPITLQVISGALDTIAEEMGHVLYRMSFSSIIRESQDLGAGSSTPSTTPSANRNRPRSTSARSPATSKASRRW